MNHTPRSAILYALGIMAAIVMFVVLAASVGPSVQTMVMASDILNNALSPILSAVVEAVNYATSLNVAKVISVAAFAAGCTCLIIQYLLRNNDVKDHQQFKLTIHKCYIWMMIIAICWSLLITFRSSSAGNFEFNFFMGLIAAVVSYFVLVLGIIWGEMTARKYRR